VARTLLSAAVETANGSARDKKENEMSSTVAKEAGHAVRNVLDFIFGFLASAVPQFAVGLLLYGIVTALKLRKLVESPGFLFIGWLIAVIPTVLFIRRIWREWRAFCLGLIAGFIIVMPVLLNP